MRAVIIAGVLWSTGAWAQTGPSVAPYTLDLFRTPKGTPATAADELRVEFRKLLREAGAVVPNSSSLKDTIERLRRKDCDKENECLVMLAVQAQTLYAVYAGVDTELGDVVVVSGRVVRDDGVELNRVKSLSAKVTAGTFVAVTRQLLAKFVSELKISSLPATRQVEKKPSEPIPTPGPSERPDAGVAVVVTSTPDAGLAASAPPTAPVEPSPVRTAGTVTLATGGAVALLGGVLLVIGGAQAQGLELREGAVARSQAQVAATSTTLQGLGTGLVVAGGVGALVGLVMRVMAPEAQAARVSVSAAPVAGGAMLSIGGTL